jgi:SecD/SecF fusion protein
MKSVRARLILLLIVLAVGAYYLYPTLKYDRLTKEESKRLVELASLSDIPLDRLAMDVYRDDVDLRSEIEASDLPPVQKEEAVDKLDYLRGPFLQDMKYYRPRAIKLGLDLQGGMYLVLEVDVLKMLDNHAKGKDEVFDRIMARLRTAEQASGTDLFDALREAATREHATLSRYWGEPGQSDATVLADLRKSAEDAVDRSLEILRNRIDQFGVSEPSVTKLGSQRIALELPGVKDPVRARELVGRTALLEFKLVVDPERTRDILTKLDEGIAARQRGESADSTRRDSTRLATDTTKAKADTAKMMASDTSRHDTGVTEAQKLFSEQMPDTTTDTTGQAHPLLRLLVGGTSNILVPAENRSRVMRLLSSRENQRLIPSDVQFLWSHKAMPAGQDRAEHWVLYVVKKQADLTGATLEDARATIGSGYDPEQAGKPIVNIKFKREGARTFARVTGANVGKRLAIVLDDKVYMAPSIRDKISGGAAVITGLDDMPEARDIAIVLRAGALPAPVHVVQERTVGPSLGHDSIAAGELCLILAFSAVVLFMLWYYRLSGSLADLAMIINMFLLLGVLAMFQFTLTMPGIAGMILTMGMAVDANVLIFERIREELRLGKTVRAAIETGFARAIVVIFDANITTAITAVVLLIYGTGSIKGFALTLTVGITANLFAAIFVTRLVYDLFTERRQLKTLSI